MRSTGVRLPAKSMPWTQYTADRSTHPPYGVGGAPYQAHVRRTPGTVRLAAAAERSAALLGPDVWHRQRAEPAERELARGAVEAAADARDRLRVGGVGHHLDARRRDLAGPVEPAGAAPVRRDAGRGGSVSASTGAGSGAAGCGGRAGSVGSGTASAVHPVSASAATTTATQLNLTIDSTSDAAAVDRCRVKLTLA